MPVDKATREAFLVDVHRYIEEQATKAAEILCRLRPPDAIAYPPNGGLTRDEELALSSSGALGSDVSAYRKIVADAIASAFFRFFAVVDAVGEPVSFSGPWLPLTFEVAGDDSDESMLHDEFFDTYWDWRELRPDPGWRLDKLYDD